MDKNEQRKDYCVDCGILLVKPGVRDIRDVVDENSCYRCGTTRFLRRRCAELDGLLREARQLMAEQFALLAETDAQWGRDWAVRVRAALRTE